MQTDRKLYFENLDGLRFISFLSVFFFHSFYTESASIAKNTTYQFVKNDFFGNGDLGVNFFFVLSGFLITYLLLQEREKRGTIDIKNFWIRRILRIWPLFYFCVAFGFIVFPSIKILFHQVSIETARPLFYLTFLNNFDLIDRGLPDSSVLSVLWSIAVEEQFYLVWPIALFFLSKKHYPFFFIIVIGISIVFRIVFDDPMLNNFHTLSCMGDLATGAMGAWLIQFDKFKLTIVNFNRRLIMLLYLSVTLVFFFRDEALLSTHCGRIFERPLIAILFILVILEQNYSINSLFKMSRAKVLSYLGKISYGLYCLHFIGILTMTVVVRWLGLNTDLWKVLILETFIALTLTIAMAFLSYRYLETPFLRMKKRFE